RRSAAQSSASIRGRRVPLDSLLCTSLELTRRDRKFLADIREHRSASTVRSRNGRQGWACLPPTLAALCAVCALDRRGSSSCAAVRFVHNPADQGLTRGNPALRQDRG